MKSAKQNCSESFKKLKEAYKAKDWNEVRYQVIMLGEYVEIMQEEEREKEEEE
jgi:hypothetical protein